MTRQQIWQRERRAAGQCITCGVPADGAARCPDCQAKRRAATRLYQRRYMSERRKAA